MYQVQIVITNNAITHNAIISFLIMFHKVLFIVVFESLHFKEFHQIENKEVSTSKAFDEISLESQESVGQEFHQVGAGGHTKSGLLGSQGFAKTLFQTQNENINTKIRITFLIINKI